MTVITDGAMFHQVGIILVIGCRFRADDFQDQHL